MRKGIWEALPLLVAVCCFCTSFRGEAQNAQNDSATYRRESSAPLSYEERVAEDFSKYVPTQTYDVEGFGDSKYDAKVSSRFELENLNEFRARAQGNWDAFANGLVKMTGKLITSVADGVVGAVVGLCAVAITGKSSAFYDNAWSNLLDDVNNYLEKNFTIYKTYDQANAGFFDKDWWSMANISDTIITNLGFALGTALGIAPMGLCRRINVSFFIILLTLHWI